MELSICMIGDLKAFFDSNDGLKHFKNHSHVEIHQTTKIHEEDTCQMMDA